MSDGDDLLGRGRDKKGRRTLARFRAEYGTTRDGDLARRFNLSIREVRKLAKELALGKDRRVFPEVGWRLWSKEDLEYLTTCYGNLTNREIATHLRRTARAVMNQAVALGLEKTREHRSSVARENRSLR